MTYDYDAFTNTNYRSTSCRPFEQGSILDAKGNEGVLARHWSYSASFEGFTFCFVVCEPVGTNFRFKGGGASSSIDSLRCSFGIYADSFYQKIAPQDSNPRGELTINMIIGAASAAGDFAQGIGDARQIIGEDVASINPVRSGAISIVLNEKSPRSLAMVTGGVREAVYTRWRKR